LELTIDHHGCIVTHGQPYAFDFTSHPHTRFSPLEVLKLNGYALDSTDDREWLESPWAEDWWEENPWYLRVWREFVWRHKYHGNSWLSDKPHKMNIEQWLETMDWSNLHTLHLTGASLEALRRLSGHVLPSLRHLSLTGSYYRGDITADHLEFINNTALPLESIALQDYSALNPDTVINCIITRHGPSLKYLKYTGPQPHLAKSQISRLRHSAPYLESLDIDMSRSHLSAILNLNTSSTSTSETPTPASPSNSAPTPDPAPDADPDSPDPQSLVLRTIAGLPSLKHLTLRFPSDSDGFDWYSRPRQRDFYGFRGREEGIEDMMINHTSVPELFRYLRDQGIEDRKQAGAGSYMGTGNDAVKVKGLESLEVFVGDYDGRFTYGMAPPGQEILAWYKCSMDGKVEEEVKCKGKAAQNYYYGAYDGDWLY
jgi:hypothetical protein